jgi:biuret amidohydrolase
MVRDLAGLDPRTTAVLTMELQRGVCGDLAPSPYLTGAVRESGTDTTAVRLVNGARRTGATIVHCMFSLLSDAAGADLALPVMAAAAASPTLLRHGDPSAALLEGLGPEPGDLLAERHHGLTPFTGTDLADRLRGLGVGTVVVCGVSLNLGVPGLVSEAVGSGFDVVVATDAVVGVPVAFGNDVLRHALAYVACLATTDDILSGLAS